MVEDKKPTVSKWTSVASSVPLLLLALFLAMFALDSSLREMIILKVGTLSQFFIYVGLTFTVLNWVIGIVEST